MAQNPAIEIGQYWIFHPAENTVGWTTERHRSLKFKHQGKDPQLFRGQAVVILDYSVSEKTYQVHFTGDTPDDYFFCCPEFLVVIPAECSCSSYDLFNFGCRCGLTKSA